MELALSNALSLIHILTNTVTISGNAGSKSFSGQEWKNFFNLRAPANIQIVGGLFKTEKK